MTKKELILVEAGKLFTEKGYYGLGLSELLQNCGVPKGSFYYYFPNGKIQLIQEVLEYSYQGMRKAIAIWMEHSKSAQAGFSFMLDRLMEGIAQKRHMTSMLMSMIAIESVYLDEGINRLCKEIYADWQQFYVEILEHFGFPPAISRRKAQALFSLVHGSLISAWIKQDPQDLLLAKESLQDILAS